MRVSLAVLLRPLSLKIVCLGIFGAEGDPPTPNDPLGSRLTQNDLAQVKRGTFEPPRSIGLVVDKEQMDRK